MVDLILCKIDLHSFSEICSGRDLGSFSNSSMRRIIKGDIISDSGFLFFCGRTLFLKFKIFLKKFILLCSPVINHILRGHLWLKHPNLTAEILFRCPVHDILYHIHLIACDIARKIIK